VRTLLEKAPGTAITADTTSLVRVVLWGHPDIMIMLLEHGLRADAVDKTGETALGLAAGIGDIGMARVLLDHGADAELRSSAKPLIRAAQRDKVEMVKLLIERGADVNRMDEKGQTALAAASNKEIKKMLKEAGARNPN
jgi:ankyrin repeat protein